MKHLKAFVNSAINQSYLTLSDYPFHRYRIKTSSSKHAFLIPEELEKLEKLELPECRAHWMRTLDASLFCCYTGLRYSDFVNLSEKNIVTIDKKPWLVFNAVKTGIKFLNDIKRWHDGVQRSNPQQESLVMTGADYTALSKTADDMRIVWEIPNNDLNANANLEGNWK